MYGRMRPFLLSLRAAAVSGKLSPTQFYLLIMTKLCVQVRDEQQQSYLHGIDLRLNVFPRIFLLF